jgi:hypothetical protein
MGEKPVFFRAKNLSVNTYQISYQVPALSFKDLFAMVSHAGVKVHFFLKTVCE